MYPRRAWTLALLGLLVTAAVIPAAADAAVRATPLATFDSPVYATSPPEDPRRVFVVEQGGTIRVLRDGVKVTAPFLDITGSVQSGGEEGLLSLAFAPDYATSGRFYVYFTNTGGDIAIEEFRRSADPDRADLATRRPVLTVPHPGAENHNGGQLMFGRDGLLWVTTGDGGGQNDPDNSAQDPGSLLGKVLRVNPASGAVSIWARGLRNPFRASFDRATGDLTIADVGGGIAEEVNFEPAGTGAGLNFGWRCHEGFSVNPARSCTVANRRDPVLEQRHDSTGFCAIIGGYVVRDPALTDLNGRYVYGDNCEPRLRSAVLTRPRASDDRAVGLSIQGLSGFGEDSCGHIYATSLNGPLYRLDGDRPPLPCADAGEPGPPEIALSRRRAQRVSRQKGVIVAVTCNEVCGFTASGRMRVSGSKKRYALRKVSKLAPAGKRSRVRLRLYRKGLRAVRRTLRRKGRRAKLTVTVVARDAAGNATRRKVAIRARR
jgi:hypothetical protein